MMMRLTEMNREMSGFSGLTLNNRKSSIGGGDDSSQSRIGSGVDGNGSTILSPRSGSGVLNSGSGSGSGSGGGVNGGSGLGSLIHSPTSSIGSAKLVSASNSWGIWSNVGVEDSVAAARNRGLSWDGRIVDGTVMNTSGNRRTSAVTEPAGIVSTGSVYGLSPGLSNLTLSPSRGNVVPVSSSPRIEDQYFAYESRKTVGGSGSGGGSGSVGGGVSGGDIELPTSFRNQPKSPPYFIQNQNQPSTTTPTLSLKDRLAQIAEATREAELLHYQQSNNNSGNKSTVSSPSSISGNASINNSSTNLHHPFASPGFVSGSGGDNLGTATPIISTTPNASSIPIITPNYSEKQSRSSSFSSVWHNTNSANEEVDYQQQHGLQSKQQFLFYNQQQQQQQTPQQQQIHSHFDLGSSSGPSSNEIATELVDYPSWSKPTQQQTLTPSVGTPPLRSNSQGSDQGSLLRQQFHQQFVAPSTTPKYPTSARGSNSSYTLSSGFFRPFEPASVQTTTNNTLPVDNSAIYDSNFILPSQPHILNGKNQILPQQPLQPPQPQQQSIPQQSHHLSNNHNFHNHQPSNSRSNGTTSSKRTSDHISSNVRSPLLEEFRNNKTKKFDLKDLYGHVVEFSGDQHGSRFIQQRLESATSEEKDIIFNEIRPNCLQLMTDVFGNYVIQRFFELGSQIQKTILAKHMESHILNLSLQMYGCRVVQKAIEHILTDQQAKLIAELDGNVLKCVKDQNGNHVIQKAIERIPAENITFIFDSFHDQVYQLATHPYGCRVIQRMLEHCDEPARRALLDELHTYTTYLVEDQYGNYVVQHVIEHGQPEDRAKAIAVVRDSIVSFSRHKFASNVVEKCVLFGSVEERSELIDEILKPRPDGAIPIAIMMKDQFANYVIQKLLEVSKGSDYDRLVNAIKPQLQSLKKYTYGKHLVSIEKLLFPDDTNDNANIPTNGHGQQRKNSGGAPNSQFSRK